MDAPTENATAEVLIATDLAPVMLQEGVVKIFPNPGSAILISPVPVEFMFVQTVNQVQHVNQVQPASQVQPVNQVQLASQVQPVADPQPGTSASAATDEDQIFTKERLRDLIKEIDPNLVIEGKVEDCLLSLVDKFVDDIVEGACNFTKHRKGKAIQVNDVQQYLARNHNIITPGFGTDKLKRHKRSTMTKSHKQRTDLIHRTLRKD